MLIKAFCDGHLKCPVRYFQHLVHLDINYLSHSSCSLPGSWYDRSNILLYLDILATVLGDSGSYLNLFGGLAHVSWPTLGSCSSKDNFVVRALVLSWSVSLTLLLLSSHSVLACVIHGGGRWAMGSIRLGREGISLDLVPRPPRTEKLLVCSF